MELELAARMLYCNRMSHAAHTHDHAHCTAELLARAERTCERRGSRLTGQARPDSDLDLAVRFERGLDVSGRLDATLSIIDALTALNAPTPPAAQQIIARVGPVTGPTQRQLQDKPHHFTRFSMPLLARSRPVLAP